MVERSKTQKRCPKCGISIGRSNFCGSCGTKGVEIEWIKCPCGETYDKKCDLNYCTECGRQLREIPEPYEVYVKMCVGCELDEGIACSTPSREINYEVFKKKGKCPCRMEAK